MSVPAYSQYQESDAGWLGAIPKHWSLEPLRGQFDELKHKNVGALNQNYLSLVAGRGVMPYAEKGEMGNKKPDDLEKCKLVKAGNFVINSMNFGIGAFGVSTHDGVCSPVYVVLEPSEPRSLRYLRWIFDNPGFREVAQSFGNGILAHRAAIGWDDLKLMKVGVPPVEEQQAIAAFLDRETAKIDALVEEQERLIALLKEKRQAVISHAVTKGLDSDTPMKDSGVEWLGEIPAHWEATTIRRCCLTVQTGGTPSSVSPAEDIDGVPWFTPGDFKNFRLQDSAKKTTIETVESGECRLFPKGCVLVVSIGATLGKLGVPSGPCSANQQINAIMPRVSLKTDWLAYSLSVMTDFMKFISNASTIGIMNQEKTKEIPIALPPIDEQDRITSYLERQSANFDGLVAEAQAAVTLLQERRAALISAAVTGKIDVRGLVEQHELEVA